MLALIGPDWLRVQHDTGRRRLEDPSDYVRQEIGLALDLEKPVIPVLFDDVPMPTAAELPEPLRDLANRDALMLRGKDFEYDRQLAELERLLRPIVGPEFLSPGTTRRPERATNPATLLSARYEVVDFIKEVRSAEIAQLRVWCDEPDSLGVRLFVGPGGTGKTRLFAEWIKRLRDEGWAAGFLPESAGEEQERFLAESGQPTFVVVDYAETRPALARLLQTLAARPPKPPGKLRLALLAREVADWWRSLSQQSAEVSETLGAAEPLVLNPISVEGPLRQEVFRRSMTAFAAVLGKSAPGPAVDLSDRHFGRVLYLELAALAALKGVPIGGPWPAAGDPGPRAALLGATVCRGGEA